MKKIVIGIFSLCLIAFCYILYNHYKNNNYITREEAKQIAMNDVSNEDGFYDFINIEYIETNNNYVYNLEFKDKTNKYYYKINAKNKRILSSKKEVINEEQEYMKESDVLEIAFNNVGLKRTECNLISSLVTIEEQIPIYNIIFYNKSIRYEYKINGLTGSIISLFKMNENA